MDLTLYILRFVNTTQAHQILRQSALFTKVASLILHALAAISLDDVCYFE